jgi:hypothetical protein
MSLYPPLETLLLVLLPEVFLLEVLLPKVLLLEVLLLTESLQAKNRVLVICEARLGEWSLPS